MKLNIFRYLAQSFSRWLKIDKNKLLRLFDSSDEIFLMVSLDGRILAVNKTAAEHFGQAIEEFSKKRLSDIISPKNSAVQKQQLENLRQQDLHDAHFFWQTCSGRAFLASCNSFVGGMGRQQTIFLTIKPLRNEGLVLRKFIRLFERNPAAMAIFTTHDQRFVEVNYAFVAKFGYSRQEVSGKTALELDILDRRDVIRQLKNILEKDRQIENFALRIRLKNSGFIDGLLSGTIFENMGQSYFLAVLLDITAQVKMLHEIEQKKSQLKNFIDASQLGTWEWNIQTGQTIFNHRWAEMLGYSLEELQPTNFDTWKRLMHPEDLKKCQKALDQHFQKVTHYYQCEARMRHKAGQEIWILDRGQVIEWDAQGRPLVMYGTHSDITEQKQMEEKIKQVSIRDPLTNIFNRKYIYDQLSLQVQKYLRDDETFAVAMLDLDFFKKVNDDFGHLAGDFILIEFAKIIHSHIRPYDLFGRFGGEEFILVSLGASKESTAAIIQRLLLFVEEKSFRFEQGKGVSEIRITFSCGICDCSDLVKSEISAEKLIGLADLRLYNAKKNGRNQVNIS